MALYLEAFLLALLKVKYLLADVDQKIGDLIIGLLVLRHLHVDMMTLLESNCASMDKKDFVEVCGIYKKELPSKIGGLIEANFGEALDYS